MIVEGLHRRRADGFSLFQLAGNRRELLGCAAKGRVYSLSRIKDDSSFETHGLSRRTVDTLAEASHSALSGVARVLVHAGRLNAKVAEDLVRSSKDKRNSFVASVIAAGAVSPADLAHTLSNALALPLLDLSSVDPQRLPRNVIDAKLAAQYQVVVLGKRGSRLFIGGADPTDQ
ncbi:MAG TPA: hypothetical protein VNU48_11430, partial [Burkholderiaceae bacterium]|nr:hypothetical protein [Burkholderiaceae bacterium]